MRVHPWKRGQPPLRKGAENAHLDRYGQPHCRQARRSPSDSTTAGLRIAVRDDVSYGVEIVQEAEPGDVVLEGARVYLDPVVAESLSEAVLDATEDGKLVIARRP